LRFPREGNVYSDFERYFLSAAAAAAAVLSGKGFFSGVSDDGRAAEQRPI